MGLALVAVGPRPMRVGPMAAACLILLCVHNADALALQRTTSALRMSTTTPETQRATDPYRALKNRHSPGVVLIDGDNCRGKSRWQFSAADMSSRVLAAAAGGRFGEPGVDAVLFLDHGEARECVVRDGGAVAFAGRRATADDVMVDAVEWWLDRGRSVVVVTSDFGLRQRANYHAARFARGNGPGGKASEHVRFVAAEALVEAFEGEAPPAPRAYERPFADALDRLAEHVLTAPSSVRARKRRRAGQRAPKDIVGSPLGKEQTWMRVVMAEKLRWLLRTAGDAPRACDGELVAFQAAFRDDDDDGDDAPPKVLQHRLTDKKHRHELLRFADALRRPRREDGGDEAAAPVATAVPEPPRETNPANNRRLRRSTRRKAKRLQDVRGVAAAAASDAGPKTKALLADRDDLERALRAWLRSDDDDAGVAAEDPAAR